MNWRVWLAGALFLFGMGFFIAGVEPLGHSARGRMVMIMGILGVGVGILGILISFLLVPEQSEYRDFEARDTGIRVSIPGDELSEKAFRTRFAETLSETLKANGHPATDIDEMIHEGSWTEDDCAAKYLTHPQRGSIVANVPLFRRFREDTDAKQRAINALERLQEGGGS